MIFNFFFVLVIYADGEVGSEIFDNFFRKCDHVWNVLYLCSMDSLTKCMEYERRNNM